jgi:hypothetical protein
VPAATVALVDSALRRSHGRPLPPTFACLTVRHIMLGRAAAQPGKPTLPAVPGILSGKPFELACAHSDLGLYVHPAALRAGHPAARRPACGHIRPVLRAACVGILSQYK